MMMMMMMIPVHVNYSTPGREQSIIMSMSVCVCVFTIIFQETHVKTLPNFRYMFPVDVAQSFSAK